MHACISKISFCLSILFAVSMAGAGEPLQVFILVGQSNMQGQANISTAAQMAAAPEAKVLYDKMFDAAGKPRVYNDIRVAAFSQSRGNKDVEKAGPLTAGFGSDLTKKDVCGPELGFGITMQNILKRPILIIKTAWGGKSLYGDFRPPSAGAFERAKNPEATGHYYRLMVKDVEKVLADPGKYHPAYNKTDGYKIAGFVWFQGWNDMVNGGVYPNRYKPGGYAAYTEVMADFIRDVRKDFNAPKMPFVSGVLGVGGPTKLYKSPRYKGVHQYFRDAMAAPAAMPEFKGNVKAVLTETFWPADVDAAVGKAGECNKLAKEALKKEQENNPKLTGRAAHDWQKKYAEKLMAQRLTAADRLALSGKSNQGFHYLGNLKFYSLAGQAFAQAIAECK